MSISRRHALTLGAATALAAGIPRNALAQAPAAAGTLLAPKPGNWRSFEITTSVDIASASGPVQAWVPVPAFTGEGWIKPGETTWTVTGGTAARATDAKSGATMVRADWPAGAKPSLVVTSRFATRDRAVDIAATKADAALAAADRVRYTAASELTPIDGIVKETADKITAGATSEIDKAKRLYEWIVDNTFRNPKTRGCGTGDIASMLKSGNLGGKCADLNALYVGLARASGLPARDLYGIRVAPSALGYKSLGANAAVVTKAQHCRAEVFINGLGWLPIDPADVRKVVLEEPPGNLALDDAKVKAARGALFGAWETNWLAYNDAHDVALPGSSGPSLPFLMYPQAEVGGARLDALDADTFKYVITAREVTA